MQKQIPGAHLQSKLNSSIVTGLSYTKYLPTRAIKVRLITQITRFKARSQNCGNASISYVMSICPYETTRLSLDGF